MKRFRYRYESDILFSAPVSAHSWLLRCIPKEEPFQQVERSLMSVGVAMGEGGTLSLPVSHGRDAFGSAVQTGYALGRHNRFRILSEGVVRQTPYRICAAAHGMFLAPSALTLPNEDMKRFALSSMAQGGTCSCDALEKAISLCDAVHAYMTYVPGATTVNTTAQEAFHLRRGVCQDYAHILIALLRSIGIPARYVCGYLVGEGATHAWVECFHNGVWRGLDPSNNRLLSYGCIKVAHGRDSADCPVNRGVFTGLALQKNTLVIKVEEV